MAKVTWKGEDELHGNPESGGLGGPSFTTAFGGLKFPKGKAVDVVDRDTIARAQKNPFFDVENDPPEHEPPEPETPRRGPGRPPRVRTDDGDKD